MTVSTAARASGPCVVIAELELKPERLDAFVQIARSFAAECLTRESGCREFQVVRLATEPHRVLFFEVYDDVAAFEAHRVSDHLPRFQAAFQDMVTAQRPLRQGWLEQAGS